MHGSRVRKPVPPPILYAMLESEPLGGLGIAISHNLTIPNNYHVAIRGALEEFCRCGGRFDPGFGDADNDNVIVNTLIRFES